MTQQEFTERVIVEVSEKEFEAINLVYMNSDLDKDEFCKMWCKMNKTRVEDAKIERRIQARDEAFRDALHKFYHKTGLKSYNEQVTTPICYAKISCYEVQALSHAGISVVDDYGVCKSLFDIRCDINEYLNK